MQTESFKTLRKHPAEDVSSANPSVPADSDLEGRKLTGAFAVASRALRHSIHSLREALRGHCRGQNVMHSASAIITCGGPREEISAACSKASLLVRRQTLAMLPWTGKNVRDPVIRRIAFFPKNFRCDDLSFSLKAANCHAHMLLLIA